MRVCLLGGAHACARVVRAGGHRRHGDGARFFRAGARVDFVRGLLALVAGLFRTWVPSDLLSQHQLQACVEAMFAALSSPWQLQEAAKQWHAQQGTGQRYR